MMTSECSSESMDDIFEELDCFLFDGRNKRLVLDPLGELVNDDVYIPKITWCRLERPDHVQSPACEVPRGWNRLDLMCWYMDSLGEELTTFTAAD